MKITRSTALKLASAAHMPPWSHSRPARVRRGGRKFRLTWAGISPYPAAVDRRVPPDDYGDDDDSAGYGSFFVMEGSPEEAAALAALRERFGDEMVDHLQRSLELMRHPQPLTDSEREMIQVAIAPVLRDLEASGAIVPEVHYEGRAERGSTGAWFFSGGDPLLDCPATERVVRLAGQLQEWEIEQLFKAGRSATWPECPEHPDSHPLEPDVDDEDVAIWYCPRSKDVICAIGALASRL